MPSCDATLGLQLRILIGVPAFLAKEMHVLHRNWPPSERHLGQVGVRIARVGRYFRIKLIRLLKNRVFVGKLNFGDDLARVLPLKHVNLPNQALPRDLVPKFLDDPASRKPSKAAVCHRDLVFELKPPDL